MRCEVCGKEMNINYGNANTIICSECRDKEAAAQLMKNSENANDSLTKIPNDEPLTFHYRDLKEKSLMFLHYLFVIFGSFLLILGLVVLMDGLVFPDGIMYFSIAFLFIAIGLIIPYIIAIEKNTRRDKDRED